MCAVACSAHPRFLTTTATHKTPSYTKQRKQHAVEQRTQAPLVLELTERATQGKGATANTGTAEAKAHTSSKAAWPDWHESRKIPCCKTHRDAQRHGKALHSRGGGNKTPASSRQQTANKLHRSTGGPDSSSVCAKPQLASRGPTLPLDPTQWCACAAHSWKRTEPTNTPAY